MPIAATVATPMAKKASSQVGLEPSSTESVRAPASKVCARQSTVSAASTAMLSSDRRRTVPSRSAVSPRMFWPITNAKQATMIATCAADSSAPPQMPAT